MKRVAINIQYENKNYLSDYTNLSDEDVDRLRTTCENLSSGKMTYLRIVSDNKEYYFPSAIVANSIISLVFATITN